METKHILLHQAAKGSRLIIVEVPEGRAKAQLIRLGVVKGEFIRCLERLPGGTVVIQKHRQEIAIGVALARSIIVAHATSEPLTGAQ
ncbi:MAG TPA: ferrous iron transport protein A [Bacteroidota bacterium]|nr:ferrous iron transport protein A [Bacteroidota bacterium]